MLCSILDPSNGRRIFSLGSPWTSAGTMLRERDLAARFTTATAMLYHCGCGSIVLPGNTGVRATDPTARRTTAFCS